MRLRGRNGGTTRALLALALVILLGGCAIAQRFQTDPVGAALVTIETQWSKARETFYAADAEAILACQAQIDGPVNDCRNARCQKPACVSFRENLDPNVTLSYQLAFSTYERAKASPTTADAVRAVGQDAISGLQILQSLDEKRAPLYAGMAAAIYQALAELPTFLPAEGGAQ